MKKKIKLIIYGILNKSLLSSNIQRKEKELKKKLTKIVPDLTNQYTTFKIDMNNKYLVNKIRCQHSFQMSIALKAIELLKITRRGEDMDINIVDIGDSSGTHLIYLNKLLENNKINTLSVNLDPVAVDKIKDKGLNALLCRAEELHLNSEGFKADIFLSYEMLEHLFNPIDFLHTMAEKSECEYFVITVPYVYKSRVACQFVNNGLTGDFQAENTHIFELSPNDWDTIFKFSGWEIVYKDKYTQYPNLFPLNMTKYLWRKFDFDGFYGVILKKNSTYSKRYLDW
ncbi:MAG: hypothetical protein QM493_00655 [Sulfurovum sp.]